MKRFEIIKPEIEKLYQSIPDELNRNLCIHHHQNVVSALSKHTDSEVLLVAGYLHDCGLYLGLRGNHAQTSAKYAIEFLTPFNLFSQDELKLIYEVIKVHSDKKNTHFHEAELLKKADVYAHHLSDL